MFIQTYSATSPFNPHREMDKTFSPSYSSSQIAYVEAEAVAFLRFRFHRKRTASKESSFQLPLPHPWACDRQQNQFVHPGADERQRALTAVPEALRSPSYDTLH